MIVVRVTKHFPPKISRRERDRKIPRKTISAKFYRSGSRVEQYPDCPWPKELFGMLVNKTAPAPITGVTANGNAGTDKKPGGDPNVILTTIEWV